MIDYCDRVERFFPELASKRCDDKVYNVQVLTIFIPSADELRLLANQVQEKLSNLNTYMFPVYATGVEFCQENRINQIIAMVHVPEFVRVIRHLVADHLMPLGGHVAHEESYEWKPKLILFKSTTGVEERIPTSPYRDAPNLFKPYWRTEYVSTLRFCKVAERDETIWDWNSVENRLCLDYLYIENDANE